MYTAASQIIAAVDVEDGARRGWSQKKEAVLCKKGRNRCIIDLNWRKDPMQIEEEVKADVEQLLAMVCHDKTDPVAYEFVVNRLTRMAILGTAPPSCQITKKNEPTVSMQPISREPGLRRRHSAFDAEDDAALGEWSRAKENFIAR